MCPLAVILALASLTFGTFFRHQVNVLISILELLNAMLFLSVHFIAFIPPFASYSNNYSIESTVIILPNSSMNDVTMYPSSSEFTGFNTSLGYIANRTGDNGDPCGTPVFTFASSY